jgi:hypothetical protein
MWEFFMKLNVWKFYCYNLQILVYENNLHWKADFNFKIFFSYMPFFSPQNISYVVLSYNILYAFFLRVAWILTTPSTPTIHVFVEFIYRMYLESAHRMSVEFAYRVSVEFAYRVSVEFLYWMSVELAYSVRRVRTQDVRRVRTQDVCRRFIQNLVFY